MVVDAALPGSDQWPWGTAPAAGPVGPLGRPIASDPWGVCSFLSLDRPSCARVCGVLGHLARVDRCARSVCCVACAVSWATWLLFTGVPACSVVLRLRFSGPLGSCSLVRPLSVLLCLWGVPGHLAPADRCARSACCVAFAVSCATWLLFTGVPARCVVLRVPCPGPFGSCSLVCPLGMLCCVYGVPGNLAPVHCCAPSVPCFACAVSWATWLLFTAVPARFVVLCQRCGWPLGCCSTLRPLGALLCVCGVLGHLAPFWRCARSVCCVPCGVSWATWRLLTSVLAPSLALLVRCPGPLGSCSWVCRLRVMCCVCSIPGHLAPVHRCAARCVVLPVRCPGPLGSCSPVCPRALLCCVCGVQGHLALVHWCARSVCCFACGVSWATWLLLTGGPARCVVLRLRCLGPLGCCSQVCPLGVLFCVCGVLGPLAPVHQCARLLCYVACVVFWATWLLFTGVPVCSVVLRLRCPGPLGSCSLVRPLGVLLCLWGVLGHLAPAHRWARSVCCVACAVSWAIWLLFTGVPACCVMLRVWCSGQLGSCSPVCPLGAFLCVCCVHGHPPPVHRCARSVCCVASAVWWATWLLFNSAPAWCVTLRVRCTAPLGSCSAVCLLGMWCCLRGVWATWRLFTGVRAPSFALLVRCPGPLGSCSRVCPLRVMCCVCGVLGHLAPVHRCATRCVVLRLRCPGPLGSCSLVCLLCVLCCLYGVLGLLDPVHQCARLMCCFECGVSRDTWLLFSGVLAPCVVLRVQCPWPLGSCSPLCPLGVLCCVCCVLGHLTPVHPSAGSVCCVGSPVSWATWLPFTGAPTRCVALLVRCPGPLGCCSQGARLLCCVACAVSWATWPLFTGDPACCVMLRVPCPWPLGSCSPVCPLGVLCWVCGVLGHLAPVPPYARSVCCVACTVSSAPWLSFTGVPAWCAVLSVRCPGTLGSCSPVCPLGVLCCVHCVLGPYQDRPLLCPFRL